MASNIKTGADYKSKSENPLKRFKFYHAFDERATSVLIEKYLEDVYKACKEGGVSLQIKSEDHFYDVCNLYTWDLEELETILKKLYFVYRPLGLFASCERVFQASVDDIVSDHIAYVQEPAVMKPVERKDLNTEEKNIVILPISTI
jgi:hypothetical protein